MTAVLRLGRSLLKFRITCGTVVRHVGGLYNLTHMPTLRDRERSP